MDENSVSVKLTITAEDYCTFQMYFSKKIIILLDIFLSLFILGLILGNIRLMDLDIVPILLYFLIFIIIIIAILITVPRQFKIKWKRQYAQSKLLQKEHTYNISSDGLERISDSDYLKYKWADMQTFCEAKEFFCIFISGNQGYFIPKRYLNDNQADIIRGHLKNLPVFRKKK